MKRIPCGYGLPALYEGKGSIFVRVNREEFDQITPYLDYRFDFGSLFNKYYLLLVFETKFTTETGLTCISLSFFDVKNSKDLKVLRLILNQGYIDFWFFYDIEGTWMNYQIELAKSQRKTLEGMIEMIIIGIDVIPEEQRDPHKALETAVKKKVKKFSLKDFLKDLDKFEEMYRKYLKENN
ncbi:MAG: hypothetical protein ACE5WD_10530 [Candidatus Aminicenantia bacterium]